MQRLLEQKLPTGVGFSNQGLTRGQNRTHLRIILLIIVVAAYLAFYVIPSWSLGDEDLRATPPQSTSTHRSTSTTQNVLPPPQRVSLSPESLDHSPDLSDDKVVPMLEPWGYNKDRNIPRWRAIYRSIQSDRKTKFTLVDYGADQGFFSISTSKFFPEAMVVGLELGGVGGEIWSKGKKAMDVLSIQEQHLEELALSNMMICQTTMHQSHFYKLREIGARSDYQLMLSVFHWFQLPTRSDFEEAVIALFSNAQTTFIELPTIGDNSDLIRRQVGYKNFAAWYDGRTNIKEILLDAASAQHVSLRVELILSSPWARWTREVYRVDYLGELPSAKGFQCEERRRIYECKQRAKFSTCPRDN